MTGDIARRLRKLEKLVLQRRADTGPDLVAELLERRRKRAIAEGREPEPDPPGGVLVDARGCPLVLSEILQLHFKARLPNKD
jgi:hypothetical protein